MEDPNEEDQDSSQDESTQMSGSVSTRSLISGSFTLDSIMGKLDDLGPRDSSLNDKYEDENNMSNMEQKREEKKNLGRLKETESFENRGDGHIAPEKNNPFLISDHQNNDKMSFFSLIEAAKLLQSHVRNTSGSLGRQPRPNIKLNYIFPILSSEKSSSSRNNFSSHTGGVSQILEVFKELIDTIISCVREEKDDIEESEKGTDKCIMPSLLQIPALSILFGHLRKDVILKNEYYYSCENDKIDANLVLSRFISLLEHMHNLVLSISDVDNYQTSLRQLEVRVFQIILAVVGEGVFLIKEINAIIVKLKVQNIDNNTSKSIDESSKKESNAQEQDPSQINNRQQQRQRRNEGAIFRTSMTVINMDEDDDLLGRNVPQKEMRDLWERLMQWAANTEEYLHVYCSDSSMNVSITLHKDTQALMSLAEKVVKSSNDPLGSMTSSLATIARERKRISEKAALKDLKERMDKKAVETNGILMKSWNQVDMKEIESLVHDKSRTLLSKQEVIGLSTVIVPAFFYDAFFFFRGESPSFFVFYACIFSALAYFTKISMFGHPKKVKYTYMLKAEYTPLALIQNRFEKGSNVPRKEMKEKLISTLIHQAQINKKSRRKIKPPNTTLLTGLPGCGTTTLATVAVESKDIINHFHCGIVWLSLGPYPLTYGGLIELYRQICTQIFVDSADAFFDLTRFNMHPENDDDEKDLMLELRQEMIDLLDSKKKKWKSRSLIVIDGLNSIEDLLFFQFYGVASKSSETSDEHYFLGPSVLVTKNTTEIITSMTQHKELANAEMIQLMPLTNDEVMMILQSESANVEKIIRTENLSYYESQMRKVVLEQCRRLPLFIKLIARLMKTKKLLEYVDNDVFWEKIYSFLQDELNSTYGPNEKMQEDNRTLSFINLIFSPDGIANDGLVKVLEVCFSSLVVVFMDSSCFLNDHPNYSRDALFVPWTAVHLFWNALLDSDEISNQEIVEFEQAFFQYQQKKESNFVISRVSFIQSLLESLGLIKSTFYKSENDNNILRGIYIPNESIKFSAESLVTIDNSENTHADDDFDKKEREWNTTFIHAYEEKFKKHSLNMEVLSTVGIDQINEEELTFLLQFLPHHLIAAGMLDVAGKMLAGCGFVKNRLNYMGIVNGTKQHIKDSEFLLEMSNKDAQTQQEARGRMEAIDFVAAKSSVVMAYEQVADHLNEYAGSIDSEESNLFEVASLLHALGCSIQRQGWRNEAFVFFQEALHLSKNDFLLNEVPGSLSKLVPRILFSIGLVSFENNDYSEAVKDLNEAIEYLNALDNESSWTRFAADLHHNLGIALYLGEDYELAFDSLSKALKIHGYVKSAPSIEKADINYHIGKIEQSLGNLDDAIKRYSECLHFRKKIFGYEHIDVARVLHALGDVCQERGDIIEAIRIYTEASQVWKSTYHVDNAAGIDYAHTLHSLGVLYRHEDMLSEAMIAYQESLRVRKSILGSFHVDVAQSYHNIGIVHCENGAYDEAMKAYAKALRVREELLGTGSADFSNTLHNIGVVIRQKGDTDEARQAFMEALWVAKALDIDAPSADLLRERCAVLFGARILDKRCVSSRIFACATLMVETMLKKEENTDNQTDSVLSPSLMSWIRPLLPVLTAHVDAEIAALENPTKHSIAKNQEIQNLRSVRFCSFDFSTIMMPVDITLGSNMHLEICIQSLEKILQETEQFCIDASSTELQDELGGEVKINDEHNILTKILLVFHAMSSIVDGNPLREACSNVMPEEGDSKWPPSRFIKAAELYRDEFEAILANIESRQEGTIESETSILTHVRQKLSTYLGSAIRFHLRRFFDPTPLSYTLHSDEHPSPDFSDCRSKVHELVWMASNDENASTKSSVMDSSNVLYEAPISYVLNLAIRRMNEYYEAQPDIIRITRADSAESIESQEKLYRPQRRQSIVQYTRLSSSSLHCLNKETSDLPITSEDDVQDILEDIMLAKIALSASGAAQFISSLFLWPDVIESIEEVGGWHNNIELFASIFHRHNLHRDNPEDGHMILLKDIDEFLKQLEKERAKMDEVGSAGEDILNLFWDRFKGGSRENRENTHENIIRQALIDDSCNLVFPVLVEPETDD